MAVTQNTYTGDGTTVLFSFTFPYLETTDIKVSLNGTNTTAYTLANATTIQFNTAPVNGAAIRIYRQTDDSALAATFYPGSAIRSADLNENFTQNLYVTQESTNNAATATSTANTALTNSNTAISTANTALSTANTASSNASAAVSTANTASSNASAAVSTANTASSNATTAVNTANAATATANSAASDAATALSTANAATSTANAASTAATNAVNTANAASSAASSAVSTANTASTNASNAVTTANTASSNATTAVNTANSAVATANSAAAAVANAVIYTIVANVAAIPSSPSNNTAIEVANSTGIESFTPLAGKPGGFVGNSGLSVRIIYSTSGSTWNWVQYFPNDPEARYLKLSGGTLTGALLADDSTSVASPVIAFDGDTNTGVAHTGADELALVTGGTARLTVDPSGNVAVSGGLTKGGNNVVTTGDTGTVTSTMIADGTIVNADINASAAIAGTKISPDFGSQTITTTGVVSAAAGAAGTPSIAFTGDLNTGIYSPGADQVAISTGGSGRLFVDASGNVGVATSSPGTRLHVNDGFIRTSRYGAAGVVQLDRAQGTATSPTAISSSAGIGAIQARGFDGSNYQVGGALFFITDGAVSSTSSPAAFTVETTPSGSTTSQERLRITSAGNVGIGTTNPTSRLRVTGTSGTPQLEAGTNANIISLNAYDSDTIYMTAVASNATQFGFGSASNIPTFFMTNNTERLRITAAGLVGVGTSSPSPYQLYVNTTGAYSAVFQTNTDQSSNSAARRISLTAQNFRPTIQGELLSSGWVATDLLLNPSGGNVGVGTTSPTQALDVRAANAAGTTYISVDNTSTTATSLAGIYFSQGGTPKHSITAATYGTDYMAFNIGSAGVITERARIDSSGRLLVGTSSASTTLNALTAKLQVQGTSVFDTGASIALWEAGTNPAPLNLVKSRGASVGTHTIVQNNDTLGRIAFGGSDGTDFELAAYIEAFVDGTPGANDMPGRIVLSTTLDGASSPTEALRITNDAVVAYNQAAPAAVNTTATLTVANLKTGIITSTTAAAVTMTLPTGTLTEGGFSGAYNNMTFEWSVINTGGTNAVTVQAGTDHTLVGSGTVSANNSGRFATRRTALSTWVTYRLSS